MAGRPRKEYSPNHLLHTNTRPRRRVDISTVAKAERRRLEAFTAQFQELIAEEAATGDISSNSIAQAAFELDIAPYEVVNAIYQYKAYHATYKDESPANAFTPPLPGKKKTTVETTSDEEKVSSYRPPDGAEKPPRRPHISTILEPRRSEIIAQADRVMQLVLATRRNGNRAPDGARLAAATDLGVELVTIDKYVKQLEDYLAAYPDEAPANAFTPLPRGRPKGRTVPEHISDAIEKAYVNTKWPTLNSDGTTTEIDQPLGPALIHDFIGKTHDYAHSHWTTRRIINDYRADHTAEVEVLRGDTELLQKVMPWIKNKVPGCWARVQVDIRDLPWVVNYNGIHCTIRIVLFAEDY